MHSNSDQKYKPKVSLDKPGRYRKTDFIPKRSNGFIHGLQGDYDVLKVIADGGTSIVKEIKDIRTGKIRILKIIFAHKKERKKNSYTISPRGARRSYKQEYRILYKLRRIDPVIIVKRSEKKEEDTYQIVMDKVEGDELSKCISTNSLPTEPKALLQIALNILLDLYKMHKAGILLIDDKTENIMLNGLNIMRVDFGFAVDGYDFNTDPGITIGYRGTYGNSAPEVLDALKKTRSLVTFNKATDIYTTGVVLRELLLGEDFTNGNYNKPTVIQKLRSSYIDEYPQIRELLLKMTSTEPKNRPSTLEEMIAPFETALGLRIGSSIAALENEEKPTTSNQSSSMDMLAELDRILPDPVPAEPKKLTDAQLKQAWIDYKYEKDKFFGIRWLFSSESTYQIIMELTNHKKVDMNAYEYEYKKNETKIPNFKQDRYQKAKQFILQNKHRTFARKLANVMNDQDIKVAIRNARCCLK